MTMTVAKFGGSLLSGGDGLRKVRTEILALPTPLVVVVSAFAGVTNLLERLAATAVRDQASARLLFDEIIATHNSVARDVLDTDELTAWETNVASIVQRLDEVVRGLGIVRELSGRTLDLVVSMGERLSSSLVVAALRQCNAEVAYVSALDVVITDNVHRYARPSLELTRERVDSRLRPSLDTSGIVVTEGYIARSTSGEVTTMGRESSDYSATMLSEMLNAERVRIYTGVPGIMTADPVVVPQAKVLDTMSYSAAHVLAELGAKILHARTVAPAERGCIPLIISSLDSAGTIVGPAGGNLASVALLAESELISLELATAGEPVEAMIARIGALVPVIWSVRFRHRLQIVTAGRIDLNDLPLTLLREPPRSIERRSVAIVSIVSESGVSARSLTTLSGALEGVPVVGMQAGVDSHSVSLIVERMDAVDVVRRLHAVVVQDGVSL